MLYKKILIHSPTFENLKRNYLKESRYVPNYIICNNVILLTFGIYIHQLISLQFLCDDSESL